MDKISLDSREFRERARLALLRWEYSSARLVQIFFDSRYNDIFVIEHCMPREFTVFHDPLIRQVPIYDIISFDFSQSLHNLVLWCKSLVF